jgi:hypothetical protein
MGYRVCSSCKRNLSGSSYSNNQWRKGEGSSRCHSCVNGGYWHKNADEQRQRQQQKLDQISDLAKSIADLLENKLQISNAVDPRQTARTNDSHRANYKNHDLDNPFAQGSFRWVAKGRYTEGKREGEECVCKWFKSGGVLEASYYESDLATVQEATRLIIKWNESHFIDKIVKINQPQIWTFQTGRRDFVGKKTLQEPFIPNYQKFNSNTGWADDSMPWPRVMQALSHYTYHVSGGTALLCDLQGGVFSDGVCLTDPVVMSMGRIYGPTDLGFKGMQSFFANHTCNEFCRSDWLKMNNAKRYYFPTKGSTMEHVPTRRSRPQMSKRFTGLGTLHE